MTRVAFLRDGKEAVTYHDLAVIGINEFLDYLERCKSLEFVSLVSSAPSCPIRLLLNPI